MSRRRSLLAALLAALACTGAAGASSGAERLPSVDRWTGASAKHRQLSAAAYRFSKWWGTPRLVAVACWSDREWPRVSGRASADTTLGFWSGEEPRWLHLSPRTCRALQTLLTSRPRYANAILADAVSTLAHEMLHALGETDEAQTECYAKQTTDVLAEFLGVPVRYREQLGRLTLGTLRDLPDEYRRPDVCREDGDWDLWPGKPSPPWRIWRG